LDGSTSFRSTTAGTRAPSFSDRLQCSIERDRFGGLEKKNDDTPFQAGSVSQKVLSCPFEPRTEVFRFSLWLQPRDVEWKLIILIDFEKALS
jgi:hypothetical protein